ncbi:hypothetical protein WJX84_006224 [Apatococcus fuscideae]|uniref:Uncharacterized protein n=1 Tax=Apatococcus fuscideae TaxID=2026836 RepID=A0AAW1SW23_9CHLO
MAGFHPADSAGSAASLWRDDEDSVSPAITVHDPLKVGTRQRDREEHVNYCRFEGQSVRVHEHVQMIQTEASSIDALLLHPFRSVVTTVDGRGVLRSFSMRPHHAPVLSNCFHIASGTPAERQRTATVRALYHLNELFQGVLLAGCLGWQRACVAGLHGAGPTASRHRLAGRVLPS